MKEAAIRSILEDIVEEYIGAIEDNIDRDGVLEFEDGSTFETEKDLIENYILYLKAAYLED